MSQRRARVCETCPRAVFDSRRRFCHACTEDRMREAKARYELVRDSPADRLHPKYRQGVDLSTEEIERIIRREAQIKRQTGWRPEGWSYGFVKP